MNKIYQKYFGSNLTSYKIYIKDNFFEIINLDFYLKYNPNYDLMSDINPEIPEYEILIANMIKDLIILNKTETFPEGDDDLDLRSVHSRNKRELLKENFDCIDKCIKENYKYNLVIYCISIFMELFDVSCKKEISTYCKNLYTYLMKTPYIFFPTFYMLDFYKIDMLIGVPVINFQISNIYKNVHNTRHDVCSLIYHDICFHNKRMKLYPIKTKSKIFTDSEEECLAFLEFKYDFKDRFKFYFENMNKLIISLKDDINYTNIKFLDFKQNFVNNTIPDNKNYTKYMNAFFLFYIFHESYILGNFYYNLSENNLYQIFEYLYTFNFEDINKINFYGFLSDIFDLETKDEKYYKIYSDYFIPFSKKLKKKIKKNLEYFYREKEAIKKQLNAPNPFNFEFELGEDFRFFFNSKKTNKKSKKKNKKSKSR